MSEGEQQQKPQQPQQQVEAVADTPQPPPSATTQPDNTTTTTTTTTTEDTESPAPVASSPQAPAQAAGAEASEGAQQDVSSVATEAPQSPAPATPQEEQREEQAAPATAEAAAAPQEHKAEAEAETHNVTNQQAELGSESAQSSPTKQQTPERTKKTERDAVAAEVACSLAEVPRLTKFLDDKNARLEPMRTLYVALTERFAYCAAVLDALSTHFRARKAAAEAYTAAMAALPTLQSDTVFRTESVLSGGLEYLKRVGWTERDAFQQLTVILDDNCREVAALGAQVAAAKTQFAEAYAQHEKSAVDRLQAARSHCAAYGALLGDAETQGTTLFRRDPAAKEQAKVDPWLLFGRYCGEVVGIEDALAKTHEQLLVAMNAAARFESLVFQLARRTAQKFVAMQSNLYNKVLVDDRVAFDILDKMDEAAYRQQFAAPAMEQLLLPQQQEQQQPEQSEKKQPPLQTGSQYDALAVVCAGCLDVGGLLLWARHDAVLTRFGFLHLYPHTSDFADSDTAAALKQATLERLVSTPPALTVFLQGAKLSVDQAAGACCMRVSECVCQTARGWFGSTHKAEYLLRAPSQEQLSRWLAEMHRFI